MPNNELTQVDFDADQEVDSTLMDSDLIAAKAAWDDSAIDETVEAETTLCSSFVGQWHQLVSRTNWEKGRIISEWRQSLVAQGASSVLYSDEVWARQVGGVTAPHVGRLRRVFDQFGNTQDRYPQLSWTHFLAATDWDDAPLWLQGACDGRWSVSAMRKKRWETLGAEPGDRPDDTDLVTNELDEDFVEVAPNSNSPAAANQPAQGGRSGRKFEEEPSGISSGPIAESPDFGEEDSLNQFSPDADRAIANAAEEEPSDGVLVQPFAGLPALPDDLADAVELLKLAVVRHKASGWQAVEVDAVRNYLSAFLILLDARSR